MINMYQEADIDVYLKNKLLDIEENAYKNGFIDGRKAASRFIVDAISPIVADDCLKRITKMIRKIDVTEKFSEEFDEEMLEEVT